MHRERKSAVLLCQDKREHYTRWGIAQTRRAPLPSLLPKGLLWVCPPHQSVNRLDIRSQQKRRARLLLLSVPEKTVCYGDLNWHGRLHCCWLFRLPTLGLEA